MFDVLDLARAGVARESFENRARDALGSRAEIVFKGFLDRR